MMPKSSRLVSTALIITLIIAVFSLMAYSIEPTGEINNLRGKVEILRDGLADWGGIEAGMPVGAGDRIKTGPRAMCDIELDDGSILHVAANSEIKIESLDIKADKNESSFSLFFGKIIASVTKLKKTKMQVKTPLSVASVRGTEFAVEANDKETSVGVFDGSVAVASAELSGEELEALVQKDQETKVTPGQKPLPPGKLGEVMKKNREYMDELRDRVQELKEKLKRVPPEERAASRKLVAERFEKLRSERQDMRKKLENRKEGLRRKVTK
jgi:hypothetical protein